MPKKTSKAATKAKSPFSKDRQYDIPTGDGFTVRKSDKPLTEFEDFNRLDRTWNVSAMYMYLQNLVTGQFDIEHMNIRHVLDLKIFCLGKCNQKCLKAKCLAFTFCL